MSEITKADLVHIRRVVETYQEIVEDYPELINQEEEDELDIVVQLLKEKT